MSLDNKLLPSTSVSYQNINKSGGAKNSNSQWIGSQELHFPLLLLDCDSIVSFLWEWGNSILDCGAEINPPPTRKIINRFVMVHPPFIRPTNTTIQFKELIKCDTLIKVCDCDWKPWRHSYHMMIKRKPIAKFNRNRIGVLLFYCLL